MLRVLGWICTLFIAYVPFNWMRLAFAHELPPDAGALSFVIGTAVCWGLAGLFGYLLLRSAKAAKRRAAEEARILAELEARPLTPMKPSQALLQEGETAYAATNARLMEEKTVGYTGATSGVSVRIMKGVSVRSGGMRGHAVRAPVVTATGEMVITDKRIIFSGDQKSFALPIAKLVTAKRYADGFGFSDGHATHILVVDNLHERTAFAAAMNKILQQR